MTKERLCWVSKGEKPHKMQKFLDRHKRERGEKYYVRVSREKVFVLLVLVLLHENKTHPCINNRQHTVRIIFLLVTYRLSSSASFLASVTDRTRLKSFES